MTNPIYTLTCQRCGGDGSDRHADGGNCYDCDGTGQVSNDKLADMLEHAISNSRIGTYLTFQFQEIIVEQVRRNRAAVHDPDAIIEKCVEAIRSNRIEKLPTDHGRAKNEAIDEAVESVRKIDTTEV